MRVKKHPSGNRYILAGNVWVRDFTNKVPQCLQLTEMFPKSDYHLMVRNEELNKNYPKISDEKITFRKAVIVSDGYDFERRHRLIGKFPKDVAVLAVNKVLKKWSLLGPKVPDEERRTINAYVTNNPYSEAAHCLPDRGTGYYPVCVASSKANHEFLQKYRGDVYTYAPTQEVSFGKVYNEVYYIDDYRNPVCACIGLAHQFDVSRLMLMCCDDSFAERRDSSVQLDNGLWTYPQHVRSQQIIEANLHWLVRQQDKEVKVANYSSGKEYVNAAYINSEEEAIKFFTDQEEGTNNEQKTALTA